jgi:glucose-6-phosphate isomerase
MGLVERSRILWDRYRKYICDAPEVGLSLDVSRVRFTEDYFNQMLPRLLSAFRSMQDLESGSIANQQEKRMVGHYWLRAPSLAPSPDLQAEIKGSLEAVRSFAYQLATGAIAGGQGRFQHFLHVGIGGSSLGPQLISDALATGIQPLNVYFLDNCDPDGLDRVMCQLNGALGRTLVSVVSKSGWTPNPMHVLRELETYYVKQGLDFSRHAVATTMAGSPLDKRAITERWLGRFPIWDWVGGRTSITSAVGLLPAAVQGVNIDEFLGGAAMMDKVTRQQNIQDNPAALLALMWYWLGNGRGDKDMVVLPYKDRLALFPRYVQQLVMESVGKELDRRGKVVHQGLTVYGHKGATDQHSYIQQLRDGTINFFVVFIRVYEDRKAQATNVEPSITLGDYLFSSLEATRNTIYEKGRDSITIALSTLSPYSMGALIALFERAVGLYAELVDINAYDQPGVDKTIADEISQLQDAVITYLRGSRRPQSAEEIAGEIRHPEQVETIYKILEHLIHNGSCDIRRLAGTNRFTDKFCVGVPNSVASLGN